jgi:VanZ family protein
VHAPRHSDTCQRVSPFTESRAGQPPGGWRAIIAAISVAAILATTVTPLPGRGTDGPPWCLSCPAFSPRAGVDFVENVLLYAPFGAALGFVGLSAWRGWLLGLVLSAVIETLQVDVIPGRFATATDVIANGFGTLLGLLAGRHWRFLVFAPPARSRRLVGVASVAMIGTIGIAGWAHQPAIDAGEVTIRVHPSAPPSDRVRSLSGRVVALSVDGREVANGARLASDRLHRALDDDPLRLTVSFLPTTVREQEPPAVEILDGGGRPIIAVREESRNVRLQLAIRADPLRLHSTFARARRLLPSRAVRSRASKAGELDTVHATAAIARRGLRIEARFGTAIAVGYYRRGVDVGWSHVVQQHGSARRIALLSGLWVSLLALPVGYWAARTTGPAAAREQRSVQRHVMALAFLSLTFAVALAFVPAVTGSAAASALQWLAAALGAMLGGVLAHGVGRRRQALHEARK